MKRFLAAVGIGIGAVVLLAPFARAGSRPKLRRVWGRLKPLRHRSSAVSDRTSIADVTDETNYGQQRLADDRTELLNSISREELLDINGIGPVLADRIISGRPYSSILEFRHRKILPRGAFDELERELDRTQRRSA